MNKWEATPEERDARKIGIVGRTETQPPVLFQHLLKMGVNQAGALVRGKSPDHENPHRKKFPTLGDLPFLSSLVEFLATWLFCFFLSVRHSRSLLRRQNHSFSQYFVQRGLQSHCRGRYPNDATLPHHRVRCCRN